MQNKFRFLAYVVKSEDLTTLFPHSPPGQQSARAMQDYLLSTPHLLFSPHLALCHLYYLLGHIGMVGTNPFLQLKFL